MKQHEFDGPRSVQSTSVSLEVLMGGRGRFSFTKCQKERSRQDKQREKAERKTQRKQEKSSGDGGMPETDLEVLVDHLSDSFVRNLGENFLTESDQEE